MKEVAEANKVNEVRGAFGIPAKVTVAGLWEVVRGQAREICARAEPLAGHGHQFVEFLENVRKAWTRPEPPPTRGEVSFLAALCGQSGLNGAKGDCHPEQIGRFLFVFMRIVNMSGSFSRITMADLDDLQFSVHLDMLGEQTRGMKAAMLGRGGS